MIYLPNIETLGREMFIYRTTAVLLGIAAILGIVSSMQDSLMMFEIAAALVGLAAIYEVITLRRNAEHYTEPETAEHE